MNVSVFNWTVYEQLFNKVPTSLPPTPLPSNSNPQAALKAGKFCSLYIKDDKSVQSPPVCFLTVAILMLKIGTSLFPRRKAQGFLHRGGHKTGGDDQKRIQSYLAFKIFENKENIPSQKSSHLAHVMQQ